MDFAALRCEDAADRVQIERVGHQHVQCFGRYSYDAAAPQMGGCAFNRFRQRVILIDLDEVGRQRFVSRVGLFPRVSLALVPGQAMEPRGTRLVYRRDPKVDQ